MTYHALTGLSRYPCYPGRRKVGMARPLNVKLIDTAKAHPARRVEIPDGGLVGLYLVIQPSGSKSWAVRYRHGGRPAKLTLGPYPRLDLRDAREARGRRCAMSR